MERPLPPGRRISIGFVLGAVLAVIGFWLRTQTIAKATDFTGNFDISGALQNASTMNRNIEIGAFLILLGGFVLLMSFWRWLTAS